MATISFMRQLVHNGVFIPPYEYKGLSIRVNGERIKLTPEQEEMAVAFARQPPERLEDKVFVKNFLKDFYAVLGINGLDQNDPIDFSEVKQWVDEEKRLKERMTREQRKALSEKRKLVREELKQRYGYALIDGEKVEIRYTVEPPCIFIGKGKHPLRGRWKPRVKYEDITLNLSRDAPTPPVPDGGSWGGRVWDPDALWIARWKDKLTGKMKYLWVGETAPVKQERERSKFDMAMRLEDNLDKIKQLVRKGLESEDEFERQVATAIFLIDLLKLRVGDEKDRDELDTKGVTTLTKNNVKILGEDTVEFNFLGKAAVRFHRTVKLPPVVLRNLRELVEKTPGKRLFPKLRSEHVNEFLSKAMPGLTSKIFRTYYASKAVLEKLYEFKTRPEDPEYKKLFIAKLANLEAAKALNHKRTLPKNWSQRLEKQVERVRKVLSEIEEVKRILKEKPTKARRRRLKKLREKLQKERIKLELMRRTRDYNLNTSLNSYIDPRIYLEWSGKTSFDWSKIYSKSLQRKISWALQTLEQEAPSVK
ncbi:MAG: DNA topoisomerase I [Candidatus Brockarchaeota archaeon]|nr:DNA topoisomerase I [Candidatus Brockarchaeota archaeon]